jgi:hypothetical protein
MLDDAELFDALGEALNDLRLHKKQIRVTEHGREGLAKVLGVPL